MVFRLGRINNAGTVDAKLHTRSRHCARDMSVDSRVASLLRKDDLLLVDDDGSCEVKFD